MQSFTTLIGFSDPRVSVLDNKYYYHEYQKVTLLT